VGVSRKLTEKQIIFVKELITNEGRITATEAALRAGYPEASARTKASALQNPKYYPLVVDYARQIREEVQKKYDVDIHRHFKELQKIREKALEEGSYSAAVQAEVARGKAAGLYVEQKIIKHGKLDQLTEGELDEKIAELMREMKIVDGELIDDSKKIVSSKAQSTKSSPKKHSKAN
jgi:phage terminase small subunit